MERNLLMAGTRGSLGQEVIDAALSFSGVEAKAGNRELEKRQLPADIEPYADKYFLRTREVLRKEELNPWVRAQVFVRKGPGTIQGIDETVEMIDRYSDFRKNGGKIYALPEGSEYGPKETIMVLEGRVQDLIALETIYLGIITAETTKANDGIAQVDLVQVRENVAAIVEAAEGRPVTYFGARHWRYNEDAGIARAAFQGGAIAASTDSGAETFGEKGVGTIPHALENIYAWVFGKERAVVEATKAFDRHIDPLVPRVALIDYNNREIRDAIATCQALGKSLTAVRVDTCGENVAEGALTGPDDPQAELWRAQGIPLPAADHPQAKYWYGTGVTITGVYQLRQALDAAGFADTQIFLTSGFGDARKVKAFIDAEKKLGVRLFDGLGVGGVYSPCRTSTMDIVAVGADGHSLQEISKVGRPYRANHRLVLQA